MKPFHLALVIPALSLSWPLSAANIASDTPAATELGERESAALRASRFLGADVKNNKGETVGEVKELMIDPVTGKVDAVILSAGGFLGLADTLTPVAFSQLTYDRQGGHFNTRLTKDEMEKMDRIQESTWTGPAGDRMWSKLREARNAIGGDVNAPDNSARNEKDMSDDRLTPEDQGSSDQDMKISRDVRSAIMKTDVSFNAKNVKIITRNGAVTLRGVVDSTAEKDSVVQTVRAAAGSATINDELTINSE
jgi:sporulation protein YlmC with PRC-barrel domain